MASCRYRRLDLRADARKHKTQLEVVVPEEGVLRSETFLELIEWVSKRLHASITRLEDARATLATKQNNAQCLLRKLQRAIDDFFCKKPSRRRRAACKNGGGNKPATQRRSRTPAVCYGVY